MISSNTLNLGKMKNILFWDNSSKDENLKYLLTSATLQLVSTADAGT